MSDLLLNHTTGFPAGMVSMPQPHHAAHVPHRLCPCLVLAHCRSHADFDFARHGWGCEPIPEKAVFYLSAAAKNAADVESLALQAGLKKGGAAKGELVLAIFELANCFRQGWGIDKDPIAAKQVCGFPDQLVLRRHAPCYASGWPCGSSLCPS